MVSTSTMTLGCANEDGGLHDLLEWQVNFPYTLFFHLISCTPSSLTSLWEYMKDDGGTNSCQTILNKRERMHLIAFDCFNHHGYSNSSDLGVLSCFSSWVPFVFFYELSMRQLIFVSNEVTQSHIKSGPLTKIQYLALTNRFSNLLLLSQNPSKC
jgi:hypothetical protein